MKKISVFFLLCIFSGFLAAQTPEVLLTKVKTDYSKEKIFIHYDKAAYLAGETIWFKVYIEEGMLPSGQSSVVKTELFNDSGKVISSLILPVSGSVASGNFNLSKLLPTGSYMVRCFTRRMMNFGSENFYTHFVNIYNDDVRSATSEELNDAIIDFLPEGGKLISNKTNSIAFICTDKKGIPLPAEGTVKNASGKGICTFKSTHNGMGKFEFTPLPGEKYTAVCNINSKWTKAVALPAAQYQGATLQIQRENGFAVIEVNCENIDNAALKPAYLLGVQDNSVVFKTQVHNAIPVSRIKIPESELFTGILQVTVFNADNNPLAERLVFNNSGKYRAEGIFKTDTLNMSARKKNVFSYEIPDTIAGTYSISITDADNEINENTNDNILSGLLLSGELKGKIYKPEYYFEKNDEAHKADLDLVMMTHGWRNFSWNEIFSGVFPSMNFKDPNYANISGTAFRSAGIPLQNEGLTFSYKIKGDNANFFTITTDSAGQFSLKSLIFEDTANFSLIGGSPKTENAYLLVNNPPLSSILSVANTIRYASRYTDPEPAKQEKIIRLSATYKVEDATAVLLSAVEVKAKIKSVLQEHEEKYMSGMMGGGTHRTLDLLEKPVKGADNILDYLKFKFAGVSIMGGNNIFTHPKPGDPPVPNYTINFRALMTVSTGHEGAVPMNVYVDEVQVDPDFVANIPASNVALVSVFSTGPFAGAGGALMIYTKKGDDRPTFNNAKSASFNIEGFSPSKEFFSPDYDHSSQSVINDDRTTLYWNPYLKTSSSGKKIHFSFYNSDKAKRLRLVLEGILEDGRMVHFEKIIE